MQMDELILSDRREEEHELVAELEEMSTSDTFFNRINGLSEQIASTAIGQYGFKKIDSILWTIEKAAKWSLPQKVWSSCSSPTIQNKDQSVTTDKNLENNDTISAPPLVRPLPWLFFIPLLLVLRLVRTAISVGALLLGKSPVTPTAMVYFIQSRRRKVRALKFAGLRSIRIRNLEKAEGMKNNWIKRKSLLPRIGDLVDTILCKRNTATLSPVMVMVKQNTEKKSDGSSRRKRLVNESEEDISDLGCNELLTKLANEKDSHDSSFVHTDFSGSTDISISENESETDNILNQTMNEKDSPKYKSPRYRKSHPNSTPNSSKKPSDNDLVKISPKHSMSHSLNSINNSENHEANVQLDSANGIQNGSEVSLVKEEVKTTPTKNATYMNGTVVGIKSRSNLNSFGSSKSPENSEVLTDVIQNLPESERNEATHLKTSVTTNNVTSTKYHNGNDNNTKARGSQHNKNHKRRNNATQNRRVTDASHQ